MWNGHWLKAVCVSLYFSAGTRRVTHCKGRIHPWQYHRSWCTYGITMSWRHCAWAVILCPSFMFFHISPWLVCLPLPLEPWLFWSHPHPCLLTLTPLNIHPCSVTSPHFTTSLSDYADLSEPPRKKDWVFWGCQICANGASQQRPHFHTAGERQQQATGEEEEPPVLYIKPAENHEQPEHSAGRVHLQEPHQITQPVLSDLLLKRWWRWRLIVKRSN